MLRLREALGEVLRQARLDQGKTLQFVAKSANISLGYLSEIERGQKEVSSELVSSVSNALEVPLWMIMQRVSWVLHCSSNMTTVIPRNVPVLAPRNNVDFRAA